MTQPTPPQGQPTAGARSQRRLGTAVLAAVVLAAVFVVPAAQASAAGDASRTFAVCERFERLVDDLFDLVFGALRPERLSQEADAAPSPAPSTHELVENDPPTLRPERLGGRPR